MELQKLATAYLLELAGSEHGNYASLVGTLWEVHSFLGTAAIDEQMRTDVMRSLCSDIASVAGFDKERLFTRVSTFGALFNDDRKAREALEPQAAP